MTNEMSKKVSLSRLLIVTVGILAISLLVIGRSILSFYSHISKNLPDVSVLSNYSPMLPTIVYSRQGNKIGEFFNEKRYPKKLSEISPILVKAFLAAEDSRFYEHSGIDFQGLFRAGIKFLAQDKVKQGGSTITQQLAKTLLLTKEKTLERKAKDILLAREIEKKLSKDKILELYLNNIFLGNNSYGVEAASQNYFKKDNINLTIAEAAMIAGLTPAPSAYAPTENYEKAKNRQRFVLEQMQKHGWITTEEMIAAMSEKVTTYHAQSPNLQIAPHFLMEVKKQLEENLKITDLASQGYTIETTIDDELQQKIQNNTENYLKKFPNKKAFTGPIKRHGQNFELAIAEMLKNKSQKPTVRAIVVDIYPDLDAVSLATEHGLGLLIDEDHRWALEASRNKKTGQMDFANLLSIGDEVNVTLKTRISPKRIGKNFNKFLNLKKFLTFYPNKKQSGALQYYALADTRDLEAASVVMDAQSGDVLAMFGGRDYSKSQFNRSTQAKRQIGSSVKPFYYSYAQDHGFGPASWIDSPPLVIGGWAPENYGKEFVGKSLLRSSLIRSLNIPSLQLFYALGPTQIIQYLNNLGFDWPTNDMSIALGSGEATVLQMTKAYSIFAHGGKPISPRYIKRIKDRQGNIIFDSISKELSVLPEFDPKNFSISPEAAYVTVNMMQDVIRSGTGTEAKGVSELAAGKTGTTNGYTDAWFTGVLPHLVSVVWVGYDDARNSIGSDGTGGKIAAPLWRSIMKETLKSYPAPSSWTTPNNISTVKMNLITGKRVINQTERHTEIPMVKGTEPESPTLRHIHGILSGTPLASVEEPAGSLNSQPPSTSEEIDSASLRPSF